MAEQKKKTPIQKDTCTSVFIAALFTVAKVWKQCECPSTDEWMKKMWCVHTVEYYSAIKSENLPFAVTCVELDGTVPSEISQRKADADDITYMWTLKNTTN